VRFIPYFALEVVSTEPTYEDKFRAWVKENNVKVGTKVRVARTFLENEDGGRCFAHDDLVGKTGIIQNICPHSLDIDMDDGGARDVPYFALEVIKEPTYRPFKNTEEFKPYRDEWFKHKESKCYDMCSSVTDYSDRGIVLCDPYSERDSLKFGFYTWGGFFEEFERENGDPCGIREEV